MTPTRATRGVDPAHPVHFPIARVFISSGMPAASTLSRSLRSRPAVVLTQLTLDGSERRVQDVFALGLSISDFLD
jgi:hypothetical protein